MTPRALVGLLASLVCVGCGGESDVPDGSAGDAQTHPDAAESIVFEDVDVFGQTSCARRSDGTASCWGEYFAEPTTFDPPVDAVEASWCGAYLLRGQQIDVVHFSACGPMALEPRIPRAGRYLSVSGGISPICAVTVEHVVRCWWGGIEPRPPPTDEPVVSVTTGGRWACVRTESGRFACWSPFDEPEPPLMPEREFAQMLPGDGYVCGLDAEGEVECWTDIVTVGDELGAPPPGPFTRIALGGRTVCGLRPGGELACWGRYPYGDLEPPDQRYRDVDVGGAHVCAITMDGELSCWGDDSFGQASPPRLTSR